MVTKQQLLSVCSTSVQAEKLTEWLNARCPSAQPFTFKGRRVFYTPTSVTENTDGTTSYGIPHPQMWSQLQAFFK